MGKGLIRGVLGVVTRPIVGLCDGLGGVSEGIQNQVKGEKIDPALRRIRIPRYVSFPTWIVSLISKDILD